MQGCNCKGPARALWDALGRCHSQLWDGARVRVDALGLDWTVQAAAKRASADQCRSLHDEINYAWARLCAGPTADYIRYVALSLGIE